MFGTSMAATTIYLSIVGGYLIAAYSVGKQLTKFQLFVISILFVLFSLWFSLASFALLQESNKFILTYGTGGASTIGGSAYLLLGLELTAIIVSLVFMLNTRKKKFPRKNKE